MQIDGQMFLDPYTHLIKRVSSTRICNPKLPSTIVKSLNNTFFIQEPLLTSISVSTTTLFNNFNYAFDNGSMTFMDNNDGLITNEEWQSFEDVLFHRHLRTTVKENFVDHLCQTDDQCFGAIKTPLHYRIITLIN